MSRRDASDGRESTAVADGGTTPGYGAAARRLTFSTRELRDFAVAWVALSVAFTVFFAGGGDTVVRSVSLGAFGTLVVLAAEDGRGRLDITEVE